MTLLVIGLLWLGSREPRLDADSLFELHSSTQRMERELRLAPADAAALEGALDVLVGEAMRELLSDNDPAKAPETVYVRVVDEARILAPVDGLTFDQVLALARDRRQEERLASLRFTRP